MWGFLLVHVELQCASYFDSQSVGGQLWTTWPKAQEIVLVDWRRAVNNALQYGANAQVVMFKHRAVTDCATVRPCPAEHPESQAAYKSRKCCLQHRTDGSTHL